jgi:DnaK suppressor protein
MTETRVNAGHRQRLLSQRAALLAQIEAQRGGVRSRADVAQEHFDRPEDSPAQVSSARDLEFAINEHETAELEQIDQALKRLDQGVYGICVDCGVEVATERLHALPQAARCMSCQEMAEHPTPTSLV